MTLAPRWDLASYFPTFDGPEHRAFAEKLESDAAALLRDAIETPALAAATEAQWSALVSRLEDVSARAGHLSSYVSCLTSADADDERYQLAEARFGGLRATIDKITTELRRGVGGATDEAFRTFTERPELDGAVFQLERLRRDARFRMDGALEGLAADLGADGIFGWGRLYDVVSSKLSFTITLPDGKTESVPMAKRRAKMSDANRSVRQQAFVQGNRAWEEAGDVVGAALNHMAGTRHILNERRGIAHVHDVALFDAAISKKTLDAMMEAVADRAEVARGGLRLKARAMKLPRVAWYDLEAPLPLPSTGSIPWDEGTERIRAAFGRRYPSLRDFFDHALAKKWVEAESRKGKRPGAFCTHSDFSNEPRVYMTYEGTLGDVSTLAHEIGHAFHGHVLTPERVLARGYPMTLAETASTFAESLLSDGLLSDPSLKLAERAQLLAEIAGDASAFLLDIPTRFFFETRFYEERKKGEVPTSRLCQLMKETQREIFGDALLEGEEDPWFWASKLHFFIAELAFYNFPYTFGFLLSRALYQRFAEEGASFLPKYEAFLRGSGRGEAHEVARATLGSDLETPEFWASAIDTLKAPLAELERILPTVLPPHP
jgi:oligoendopeptidase F